MIAVVDYGIGNLGSILNMLRKLQVPAIATSDPQQVRRADKLILPGVGAFDKGMANLEQTGLIPLLRERALTERIPVLGICLGLQLLTHGSEEGSRPGLGWLDAETIRFRAEGAPPLRVPHMGWNELTVRRFCPLFEGLDAAPRFYFVHSYHLVCHVEQDVAATTSYGYDFPSVAVSGNIAGTQFHPEKSHQFGMALLKNFAERF